MLSMLWNTDILVGGRNTAAVPSLLQETIQHRRVDCDGIELFYYLVEDGFSTIR
jgi:hypothetical protein